MSDKLGPYELNSIIHGDCLEVMPQLPDGLVDMILSDWPYGTTACEWDSIIPLEPLWKECKRVIKPGGAIVLTASQPFTSVLVMSNLSWFRYDWVWGKSQGTSAGLAKYRPLPSHESVLVFGFGKITYHPQMRQGFKPWKKQDTGKVLQNEHGYGYKNKPCLKTGGDERYPTSVFSVANEKGNGKQLHPTQKPVKLLEYLVRTYSNPGDLILDNAAGSCTLAIAAIETGRNWLCIEKEARYVEIGRERVRERLSQPFLPGMMEPAAKVEPIQLELGA